MYTIDERDEVAIFEGVPGHSPGAPMPLILATDVSLVLAYETAPSGEQYAVVKFIGPRAHYFGPPNDEAAKGHPLAERGLGYYGIYEVSNSSWIRTLEQMNRVYRNHDASRFAALRHFVFTFHDNTFECIAKGALLAANLPNESDTAGNLLSLMASHLR
ncbi:MAG: hypothetical protein WBX25_20865 [Rhodomicrobium sp.]